MNFLYFLERIAFGFWDAIRRVAGIVFPFLTSARELRRLGHALRWILHILLLVAILVGAYFLGRALSLDSVLIGPKPLRPYWLCIIILLIYVLAWMAWWLWKLLGPEEEYIEFADIKDAWEEGLRALSQAGISLTDAPLFLVLGKPQGGHDPMFVSAQLQLLVKGAPTRDDAPVRIFANRDAIFVTCAGASLLGRQTAILAGDGVDVFNSPGTGAAPLELAGGGPIDPFATLAAKGKQKDILQVLAKAREEGRGPDQLTDEERAKVKMLQAEAETEDLKRLARARPHLLKNTAEAEWLSARLRYLCRLMTHDRTPYCPLNGMLMLVPFAGTDSDEDANQTGAICHQDLVTARKALRVNCPVFAMFSDLESATGFRQFIQRFPSDQKARRLGQRFPLVPDLADAESHAEYTDRCAQWICTSLLPTWVYKLFRIESPGKGDPWEVMYENSRLYQLLNQLRERKARFGRILSRSFSMEKGDPMLFGGCYIAATGRDLLQEQAFTAGVLRRLMDEQDYVSWTNEALRQESRMQKIARLGYIGTVVGSVLLVALTIVFWDKIRR
jgi:hypothetical protein